MVAPQYHICHIHISIILTARSDCATIIIVNQKIIVYAQKIIWIIFKEVNLFLQFVAIYTLSPYKMKQNRAKLLLFYHFRKNILAKAPKNSILLTLLCKIAYFCSNCSARWSATWIFGQILFGSINCSIPPVCNW